MKRVGKVLVAAGMAALVTLPTQPADAFWGRPWVGPGWSNAYMHDPAYWTAHPRQRPYIRDVYRHGPGYAAWKQTRRNAWHPWW